jgi:hypothetical protein
MCRHDSTQRYMYRIDVRSRGAALYKFDPSLFYHMLVDLNYEILCSQNKTSISLHFTASSNMVGHVTGAMTSGRLCRAQTAASREASQSTDAARAPIYLPPQWICRG